MYVIICDYPYTTEKKLLLADRNKVPSGKHWTPLIEEALVYRSWRVANDRMLKLKYNNPQVITLEKAKECTLSIQTIASEDTQRNVQPD